MRVVLKAWRYMAMVESLVWAWLLLFIGALVVDVDEAEDADVDADKEIVI